MKARKHRWEDSTPPGAEPAREVIAKLAELLWEKEGRPAGREIEFRLQAKAALGETNKSSSDETKS